MSNDPLDFLDKGPNDEPVTTTEEISPEAPEAKVSRGEDGKFLPREAKGEAEKPAPQPAPPAVEPAPKHDVPISALLDEREKRQRFEAEAQRYRQQFEALQRQQQQPVKLPDVIEDPAGFQQFLMQQQAAMRDDLEASFSERSARKEFGKEFVDEALQAAQAQGLVQHFTTGPDRWERMATWHKQQKAMAEIGDDPDAYRSKLETTLRETLETELREKLRAEFMADSPARPRTPPPSLAGAPAASSNDTPAPGTSFDRAFPK